MSSLSLFRRTHFPEILLDDSTWGNLFKTEQKTFQPDDRVTETDEMYVYSLAVPGLAREDLDVNIEGRTLTIGYEHKVEKDNNLFAQSFQIFRFIPREVNLEEIDAKMENGVLNMYLPKKVEPERANRKIEIK